MMNVAGADQVTVFRLTDLTKIYCERLFHLGMAESIVKASWLKERIILHAPEVEASKRVRDVIIALQKRYWTSSIF